MVVGRQRHAPTALPPRNNTGNISKEGWVEPRAGLDGYEVGKMSCSHRGLNPGVSLFLLLHPRMAAP